MAYLATFNLNVVNSAKITSTTYNQATKLWTVIFQTPTGQRTAMAKHVVQATGIGSQKPYLPSMGDPHLYKGVSVHSATYQNAKDLKMLGIKSALVIGSANTAFDILEDCCAAGLKTTMVVRSPTFIFPVAYVCDPAAHGNYEKLGVEADKEAMALPTNIDAHFVREHFVHSASQEPDRYAALAESGFPVMDGRTPGCVLLSNLYEKGGGHYVDVGGTALLSEGKAGVKAGVEPVAFTTTGLRFSDGSTLDADAIVWCTGFADKDARATAAEILGASPTNPNNAYHTAATRSKDVMGPREIAARLDATWGVDAEGEIRGMWKRQLRIDNYWIMGGDTRVQRWHSRTVALQIKAALEGILPPAYRGTAVPENKERGSSRL
ncbi:putative indole-3-pyruvate monooxygenase YUCCA3 [Colletotrichum spaethianum]|uniref:L-ornithine N(5)-monooxygenase [NAD(P)H] n=1 Tax=Colletotrichum spaethianum TaxID=700344 RepID=A0AA37PHS1_9PEZI|nr:putative indole-3-pyruvate monooxygenase YUCCA3 [Colletotrichum spaethianum]GKT52255.1 putative indole-3-pyruvate monooxygenase YUCCA3 [Colletotrichum spaethianum]